MEKLLIRLNAIAPIPQHLTYQLHAMIREIKFLKGAYILKEGATCQYLYYLESGLIRIFDRQKYKENTSLLLKEDDFFTSIHSFYRQRPADENIVALEDCVCWAINYQQLKSICQSFPEFYLHRCVITEHYYYLSQQRDKILKRLPEERYSFLMEHETELLPRVPPHLLPSYLNISRSLFYILRNNYHNNKRKHF